MKRFFPSLQYMNAPNAITTMGMLFGIAASYFILAGDLQGTMICLFFSGLMDLVDGFFAEKLRQQTEFGKYVDSFVDFFICCITPVWIIYNFVGATAPLIFAVSVYAVCGLWRLAYYNAKESDGYFVGLPVPGAMLFISVCVWSVARYGVSEWALFGALLFTGVLMVSSIRLPKYGVWQKTLWGVGIAFLAAIIFAA